MWCDARREGEDKMRDGRWGGRGGEEGHGTGHIMRMSTLRVQQV
jgi:hypothetical protein